MADRLILAIPSKGRLQEQVEHYFADAGMALKKATGSRGYRADMAGFADVDVMLLSAGEIAGALLAGEVHFGITGEDLIREAAPELDGRVALLKALGFGHADVVVAVPRSWIDVTSIADFDDVCAAFFQRHRRRLRVATKYVTLTRAFFAEKGIAEYRIVESAGATEGAPSAGAAEAIVDITSTGATLAANGLKILEDGVILQSQAQLAMSLKSTWSAAVRRTAERMLARLAARECAKTSLTLRARMDGDATETAVLVPRGALMEAVQDLRAKGCQTITAQDADYIFEAAPPILAAFTRALAG
ncbi:MAG: ATP phosphoribosyltransferase [Alphaproteobacteria bacterium]|nr:ATP phosphoribosyltransferase [Alphaproteobacteria bacterium]